MLVSRKTMRYVHNLSIFIIQKGGCVFLLLNNLISFYESEYSFLAISASLNFCTLPDRVMGNSVTTLK